MNDVCKDAMLETAAFAAVASFLAGLIIGFMVVVLSQVFGWLIITRESVEKSHAE